MDTQDRERLLKEYRSGLATRPDSPFMVFDWFVLRLLDDDAEAQRVGQCLRELMRGTADADRNDKLYAFVAGQLAASDLKKEIGKSRSFDCMAHFLSGVGSLSSGKREEAKTSFEACVATGYYNYFAYHLSRAFLVRVDDPNWLGWIKSHESPRNIPAATSPD